MTFSFGAPTIGGIQVTTAILALVTAGALALAGLPTVGEGCLFGAAVVMVNLYLLAAIGRFLLAAAGRQDFRAKLRIVAAPLKLLIYVGLIYLLLSGTHIDAIGFGLGILTQLIAIVIETGRASLQGAIG